MLVLLAAATIGMSYEPPITNRPEDTEAKGYALVFSREDRGRFSVFVKDAGKDWDSVSRVEEAAEKSTCGVDWLVYHTIIPNMDVVLHTFRNTQEDLTAKHATDDLTGYFEDDFSADNNFGLHDIY